MVSAKNAATRWSELVMRAVVALALLCSVIHAFPADAQTCVGDCNGDGSVTVDEIVTMVNIALGTGNIEDCMAGDSNGDGQITVDEILQAVNNALSGCPTGGCTTTATVTVNLDLTTVFPAGLTLELDYPSDLISIPGSVDDPEVTARVMDISGVAGFFSVVDVDSDDDQIDDRLRTQAVAAPSTYNAGAFEEVQFDCEPGATVPTPEDFLCSITQASDEFANPIDLGEIVCSVTVVTP